MRELAGETPPPAPEFAPTLPLPADREIWHEAATWADEFWRRLAASPFCHPPSPPTPAAQPLPSPTCARSPDPPSHSRQPTRPMRLPHTTLLLALLTPALHAEMTAGHLIEVRTAEYRAQKQRQQDELHAATLPAYLASLARAKTFTAYEGLPHPAAERALHEAEKKRAAVIERHGQILYAAPLALAPSDLDQLRNALNRPETYRPHSGTKLCGGFHADYAIEWTTEDHTFTALICLTCHELKLTSADSALLCDLPAASLTTFASLLQTHRSQRPATP